MDYHAFTLTEKSVVKRLRTKLYIFKKYTSGQELEESQRYVGIWDTGATETCITHKVVSDLGLTPSHTTTLSTAGGDNEVNVCCIDVMLPNNVVLTDVIVTEVHLTDGDVLIGMDVISQGDFSVTNYNGNTKLSFRIPSCRHIDYVEED